MLRRLIDVATEGRAEFILVSGHAGVGKSSVVSEFSKLVVPRRGLFAAGKFDQYKRDIPYATLAQAFQSLVRHILGLDETELKRWRHALLEALGPNGQLMVTLIPELVAIIGEQPPTPDLPPEEARNRFQMVFRRFLSAFAQPEHPLALFLDDLQWLDAATLELIEHLVAEPDVQYVLLVGSYRANELDPSHLLVRMLERIRNAGTSVREIALKPLAPGDVRRLIADALRTEAEHVRSLAKLVFEKTGGNAFFVNQFIAALAEDGLLVFDYGQARLEVGYRSDPREGLHRQRCRSHGHEDESSAQGDARSLGIARLSWKRHYSRHDRPRFRIAEKAAVHAALWQAVRAGLLLSSGRSLCVYP